MTHEPKPDTKTLTTLKWTLGFIGAALGLVLTWYTLKDRIIESAPKPGITWAEGDLRYESKEVAAVRYAMLLDRLKSIEEKQDLIIRRISRNDRADARIEP